MSWIALYFTIVNVMWCEAKCDVMWICDGSPLSEWINELSFCSACPAWTNSPNLIICALTIVLYSVPSVCESGGCQYGANREYHTDYQEDLRRLFQINQMKSFVQYAVTFALAGGSDEVGWSSLPDWVFFTTLCKNLVPGEIWERNLWRKISCGEFRVICFLVLQRIRMKRRS